MRTNEALLELRKLVKGSSQKAAAKSLGFSPQFICDVLKGRRSVSEPLAKQLGFTIQTNYIRKVQP